MLACSVSWPISLIYPQSLHWPLCVTAAALCREHGLQSLEFPSSDAGAGGNEHSATSRSHEAECRWSASCTTDPIGPVFDNSSLHQLHQELLLFRYVVSPGLQSGQRQTGQGFDVDSTVNSAVGEYGVWFAFSPWKRQGLRLVMWVGQSACPTLWSRAEVHKLWGNTSTPAQVATNYIYSFVTLFFVYVFKYF